MHLSDAELKTFDEDGYLFFPSFCKPKQRFSNKTLRPSLRLWTAMERGLA